MDILFLIKILNSVLFMTAIPPAIYLIAVFYSESKNINRNLKIINSILIASAILGTIALIASLVIAGFVVFDRQLEPFNYHIRNLLVATFFNIPTWGLLYVRKNSRNKKC